jgi:hypothetical protein
MNELEKAAEILVLSGYADYASENSNYICWHDAIVDNTMEAVQLFSDSIEGRRQADAIEDWLGNKHPKLWFKGLTDKALYRQIGYITSANQWRLDRIKYCIGELIK